MVGRVKKTAKKALQGKTGKLFLVSLFALFLRVILLSACIFTVYFLSINTAQNYINSFGFGIWFSYLIYITSAVFILLMLQTAAAIKLGETEYYGIYAGGGSARFAVLFSHCRPLSSLKALTLYVSINMFRLLWLVVMLIPCMFVAFITFLLYYDTGLSLSVFLSLSVLVISLFLTAIISWYFFIQKYCYAALFSAKSKEFSPRSGIRRSIAVFDCSGVHPAIVKISLLVPLACCVFILPAVYILPYIKMSMAALYVESKKNAKLIVYPQENKPIVLYTKKSFNW
ncbi:MAG TPA: hypothetical protein VFC76_02860 [Oscillospiraceae bacterium]|nr:hypothetical protein [Oscillospiraceae bacterium]